MLKSPLFTVVSVLVLLCMTAILVMQLIECKTLFVF